MLLSKDAQYINWQACLLDVYPQEERKAVRGKRAGCGVSQKVLRLYRHLQPTTPSSPISLFGSACQAVLHNAKNRCLTHCMWVSVGEREGEIVLFVWIYALNIVETFGKEGISCLIYWWWLRRPPSPSPPPHVKRFEYPEKLYINVTNYYLNIVCFHQVLPTQSEVHHRL